MRSALLAQFPHLNWTLLAMLLFLGVFLGWCAWAFSRKRKAHFDELSQLPLED